MAITWTSYTAGMRSLWREFTNENDTGVVPDATIDLYLQRGLEELNNQAEYYLKTSTSDVTLVAGTQEYELPVDFVKLRWLYWNDKKMEFLDEEDWNMRGSNFRTGSGAGLQEYGVMGYQLVFRPIPDAAMVATAANPKFRYVAAPPSITSSGPVAVLSQYQYLPVLWGVALWSGFYPDGPGALFRQQTAEKAFAQGAAAMRDAYRSRFVRRETGASQAGGSARA